MGLGVDDLRWMKLVRPGDLLHIEGEVVELTPSRTKPQGIAKIRWTAYNQRGEAVYTFTPIGIVPRRPNQYTESRLDRSLPSFRRPNDGTPLSRRQT
jgi:acyl dehydratase